MQIQLIQQVQKADLKVGDTIMISVTITDLSFCGQVDVRVNGVQLDGNVPASLSLGEEAVAMFKVTPAHTAEDERRDD